MKKTFKKTERLCSKKTIDALFDRKNPVNESLFAYPIKAVVSLLPHPPTPSPYGAGEKISQVLFSVSKKGFKKAVDRNLIKRRLKEAYRLNKNLLKKEFYIAFVYIGKEIERYEVIEKGIKGILKKANTV